MAAPTLNYRWRGQLLPVKSGWFNIETGRDIKDLNKKGFVYKDLAEKDPCTGKEIRAGPRICGRAEIIQQFLIENGLAPKESGGASNGAVVPVSKEDAELAAHFADQCSITDVQRANMIMKQPNVDQVSDETLKYMTTFQISGLEGLGKVTRVIDGDTIEMLLYVPLASLMKRTEAVGRGYNKTYKAAAYTKDINAGFFSLFTCRLSGVDFAEHNTVQGLFGIKLMTDLYDRYDNKVYYRTSVPDKYGRLLITLYSDPYLRENINTVYADYTHPQFGRFVEAYSGKTKSDYMKNLPILTPDQITQWKAYFETLDPIFPLKKINMEAEKPKMSAEEVTELDLARD